MSTGIRGAALVPSAPLVVPAISHAQPAGTTAAVTALRRATTAAIARVSEALELDLVVLLAAGQKGLHNRARASFASLGLPDLGVDLPLAADVVSAVTRVMQYPLYQGTPLPLDLAVLARLVADASIDLPVLPVTVSPKIDPTVAPAVAAALHEGLREAGAAGVVLSAGDLSAGLDAGSPAYLLDGAVDWDHRALAAVEVGDAEGFTALGPDEAERVAARSWAPIGVTLHALRSIDAPIEQVTYHTVRGVGYVVASALARRGDDRHDPSRREGIMPRTGDPRG